MRNNQELNSAYETYLRITTNIEKVMRGQAVSIRRVLAGMFSGGHVLLDDYPGTGKTTLAKALARSIDADFKRIQFTPDLLPSDIVGVSIFNQQHQKFQFHKGPVFTNILLADEINRASPRTQSALLEAMAEKQVSLEGNKWQLEDLFFVIATQNPVESRGTYPLPEAQMDRFAMQFSLGYVSPDDEVSILNDQKTNHPLETITSCTDKNEIIHLRSVIQDVRLSKELIQYIVTIVNKTRNVEGVLLGASPRASLALMRVVKAIAFFNRSEFVHPDHIQEMAVPVISHRLILDPQARFSGLTAERVVKDIVRKIDVPV